jgi:transposase-like protein
MNLALVKMILPKVTTTRRSSSEGRTCRQYSEAEKENAVKLARNTEIHLAAKTLGISRKSVSDWVAKADEADYL